MSKSRSAVPVTLRKVDHADTDHNFREIHRALAEMAPHANGRETGYISLAAGQNKVRPTVPHPRGRQTTYQNAHATIFDVSNVVDSAGNWVVDASAPCVVKFLFY